MARRWRVTCDDCPDFAEETADEDVAERLVRAHAGRYHGTVGMTNPAQLVEDNLRFAHWMTRRAKPGRFPGETYDEVLSDAMLGLFEAARRFDPTRGFTFSTYASRCIWTHIFNGRQRRYKHTFRGMPDPLSLDAMIADNLDLIDVLPDPRDDIAAVDDADEFRWLAGLVGRLNQPHAAVLRLELDGQRPGQIAKQLGVSLQTVHNRRSAAVDRLRALAAS